jgi:hypothetical protein
MKSTLTRQSWTRQWWSGIFGGFIFWYAAHDLGFYYSAYNCFHRWILPTIHLIAFVGGLICVWLSYRAMSSSESPTIPGGRDFMARVGVGAGSIFTLVILWQGIAAIIYSGCER